MHKAGKIVSGGSSISMQVIRLARKGKSRTYLEKLIEIILATRLELRYSKNEILNIYASHAPFGGNIVGITAASWRYFGRNPEQLSWGEASLLAVLPNSPALIHPGRNRDRLIEKRNRLINRLEKLWDN
jgi:penicillin-binding protein 1C